VFVWKGCGAAGRATFGMENVAGEDAILAQGDFPPGQSCYDTADGAQFVDLPVFDAMLEQIASNYCVDEAHVFSVGFSSGAWLTQLLGCQRGNVLRGIGTVAGGFKPSFFNGAATCPGSGLSALMVSDLDDHENPFYDEDDDGDSVEIAVNQWLGAAGCSETAWSTTAGMASDPDPSVCRAYADCGPFPVKLCLTSGLGHSSQEGLAFPGFWQLFQQSLPK
jgi:poly(3-hydroxybutyrate) depolymerase